MRTTPFHHAFALAAAAGLAAAILVAGCQDTTNDQFVNPPPGPPSSCAENDQVPDCAGGSVGYVCSPNDAGRVDRPDDGDTDLVCNDGAPSALGAVAYCCAPYGQYWSDCTTETQVPDCPALSMGFRCKGPTAPGAAGQGDGTGGAPVGADAALACSAPIPSGTDSLYCCNSAALPPGCAADPSYTGCPGATVSYACTGTNPELLDPAFTCQAPAAADPEGDHHCCTLGPT